MPPPYLWPYVEIIDTPDTTGYRIIYQNGRIAEWIALRHVVTVEELGNLFEGFPSSKGRTPDFGSGNRGSMPRGKATKSVALQNRHKL